MKKSDTNIKMNYKLVLEKQLAVDYDCTLEEIQGKKNIIKIRKNNPGSRPVGDENSMLKAVCYDGKVLIMADEPLLAWCKEKLKQSDAAWLSEPRGLCMINDKLREYGHCLADTHHYYIPAGRTKQVEERFAYEWYEGREILKFAGDNRFTQALLFDERTPDMLAVCAVEDNQILGMAGVTADSENMWQMGVNITEEGKGRGIGTYVTTLLKNKVIEKGKLPFYGTVESHIKSQRVAVQSGFVPCFFELFSEKN